MISAGYKFKLAVFIVFKQQQPQQKHLCVFIFVKKTLLVYRKLRLHTKTKTEISRILHLRKKGEENHKETEIPLQKPLKEYSIHREYRMI